MTPTEYRKKLLARHKFNHGSYKQIANNELIVYLGIKLKQ